MKRVASGILPMIAVNRKAPKALHQQIYDAYRAAIVGGSLRPGQRIPSTRVLASEICVSRFPVLNAYSQLLAEGYLESRVGTGTVIARSLPDQLTSSQPAGSAHAPTPSGPRPVSSRCSILPLLLRYHGCRVGGHFVEGRWHSTDFRSTHGPTWSRAVAEV
jgi:GntR family transcriptional regulator / MocR family aminotransferase